MGMKWLLVLIALGIMITPAFAATLPNPAFTNITDLGSPACGLDYLDATYMSPMSVRMSDGTYWAGVRRECGGSNNGVIGLFKSTDNGTTFSNIANTTVCTGDSGSAADLRLLTVNNELYVQTYCSIAPFSNSEVLERINQTDGSVITAVGLNGQASCATNSTSIWCIETLGSGADLGKYTYASNLSLLNSTTFAKPLSANGGIGGMQMTSENLLEFIFWQDFTTAYYVNVTNTGVTASSYTGVVTANHASQDSMVVLPNGTKIYAYRCGVARSTNGNSWTSSTPFDGVCGSTNPVVMKYDSEPIVIYYDSSAGALKYIDSDDSGATWESPVTITDVPSQSYAVNDRGYLLPAYNNFEAHAGYIDLMVSGAGNNNLSFAPILYEDVVAPDVTIQQPVGSLTNPFNIKFTLFHESVLNSSVDQCWYSLDGGANTSLPSCANTTGSTSVGSHSITIYANDTSNNIGSSTSTFSIRAPPVTGSGAVVYSIIPLLFLLVMITIGAALMFYGSKQSDVHTVITGFVILFIGIVIFGIINGFVISQV
jgi:hypothetical protein